MSKGELYGGSMFARSAAPDTLQGKAIQAVNERWGDIMPRNKRGRESIGMAVCKKKYAPFRFYLEQPPPPSSVAADDSKTRVGTGLDWVPQPKPVLRVERMFGCPCHHEWRKAVIRQYGERPGWEPFGQWSLRKAEDIARRETARLHSLQNTVPDAEIITTDSSTEEDDSSTSRDVVGVVVDATAAAPSNVYCQFVAENTKTTPSKTLCANGNCLWRVRSAYDDVQQELLDQQEQQELLRRQETSTLEDIRSTVR